MCLGVQCSIYQADEIAEASWFEFYKYSNYQKRFWIYACMSVLRVLFWANNGPLSGWKSCKEKEAQTRKCHPVRYKLFFMMCCRNGPLCWHFPLSLQSLCVTSTSMWGWWGFYTSGDSAPGCCSQPPSLVRPMLHTQNALRLNTNASFERLFTWKQIMCGMTWENITLLTNVNIFENLTHVPTLKFVCCCFF